MDAKPLILIADDSPDMRGLVRQTLSTLDADLIEARDGEEALTLIIQEQPDLVVLDVMMPVLSGWEILRYVREKPEYGQVRVLMLTAIGATVNEMTAPLYGADAHLDKPFDVVEMINTVKRLLASPRIESEESQAEPALAED